MLNKILSLGILILISTLIILAGCSQKETFSKEDKIYNPPIPKGNEPKNPDSVINESLNNEYENYCSEVGLPKSL